MGNIKIFTTKKNKKRKYYQTTQIHQTRKEEGHLS